MYLQATRVFNENWNVKTRLVVNQGGTGSSKTHSLAQLYLIKFLTEKKKRFAVVRKSLPSLVGTAMYDFFNIMKDLEIYREANHNMSRRIYYNKQKKNEIEFFSVDEPQKVRGRQRDYIWCNEANELSLEDWRQLIMRTNIQAHLDYNPSDEFHWIYEQVLPRKDCTFIKSTYKDNPFLAEERVKEIESFRNIDLNYWKIYGEGERGISEASIYTHYRETAILPDFTEYCYGLDFGYNDPTVLIKIGFNENKIYWIEELYETHLTSQDLINKLKTIILNKNKYIFADSSRPEIIDDVYRSGFNIYPAIKDVKAGIDKIKTLPLFIDVNSINLLKEIRNYKWKIDKENKILDEPVKVNDHCMDGGRYGTYSYLEFKKKIKPPKYSLK